MKTSTIPSFRREFFGDILRFNFGRFDFELSGEMITVKSTPDLFDSHRQTNFALIFDFIL